MNKEEIIKYCLTLEDTYKDCPFPNDFESVTMKHIKNNKWFVLIMNVNDKLYINVKTNPDYSDILRNTYDYIFKISIFISLATIAFTIYVGIRKKKQF